MQCLSEWIATSCRFLRFDFVLYRGHRARKTKEADKRRGSILPRGSTGDKMVLSGERSVKTVGQGLAPLRPSLLAREGYESQAGGRTEPSDVVAVQETSYSLGVSTQLFKDQYTIDKVAFDVSGYAINKYRQVQGFHTWPGSTVETYV